MGGRITHDLKLKEVSGGLKLLDFTIANNSRSTGSGEGGQRSDKPHYFRCEVWGKPAEIIYNNFKKGDPITVIGTLNWSQWEDKETKTNKEAVKIRVDNFFFANGGRSSSGSSNPQEESSGPDTQTFNTRAPAPIPDDASLCRTAPTRAPHPSRTPGVSVTNTAHSRPPAPWETSPLQDAEDDIPF